MRKNMFSFGAVFALMILGMLFSCEKPLVSDENESGATKGNLRVSVFEIEKTPFASLTRAANNSLTRGTEAASAVVTRLNFAIYDQSGLRLKQINQTSDQTGLEQHRSN